MQNNTLHIKSEPKDEDYLSDSYNTTQPLRTLVLRFIRHNTGNYSVVPLIKPDPFFEETLDDFYQEDITHTFIKTQEAAKLQEITVCKAESGIIKKEYINVKEEYMEEDNTTTASRNLIEAKKIKYAKKGNRNVRPCQKCWYLNNKVNPARAHLCPFCYQDFKEHFALETHIFRRHMDVSEAEAMIANKILSCDFCRYRSIKRSNFRRHLAIHGANKLRNRLSEGGENKNRNILKQSEYDIKMALKKSTYNCYHCIYKTKEKWSMIKHTRLHNSSDRMPFSCSDCNRKFNEKKSLDSHIVKHHLEDPDLLGSVTNKIYACELCCYKDVNKSKLTRHKKSRHVEKKRKEL